MNELNGKKILIHGIAGALIAILLIAFIHFLPQIINLSVQEKFASVAILITDPAIAPEEVSGIYLFFENILLHNVKKGWILTNISESLNLLSLINITQIILVKNIFSGTYDLIKLINVKIIVEYLGENYTAEIPSKEFLIKIKEELRIDIGDLKGILIDINPKILLFTREKQINFIAIPSMNAIKIENIQDLFPNIPKEKIKEFLIKKHKINLKFTKIYDRIRREGIGGKIEIINATLTKDKLEVYVKNVGNILVNLRIVMLYQTISFGKINNVNVASIMASIFLISSDGKLIHLGKGLDYKELIKESNKTGYELNPGEVIKLIYEGEIEIKKIIKGLEENTLAKIIPIKHVNNIPIKMSETFILMVIAYPHTFDKINIKISE